MFAVSDVWGKYLHKRLYEVGDIVRKLIGGAVTCCYYWSNWYIGLMYLAETIEEWSASGLG